MSLGSPKKRSSYLERLGKYSINPRQVIAFEMLCADAVHTCRLDPRLSLALGRGTARLHRLQTLLGEISLEIACGSHIDLDSAESVALPVSVSEIIKRVPLDCGKCHPELYLKGKHLQTFLHQEHLVVSEEPFAAALPKPCYRVEEREEDKLREELLRRGFSCLIPESQVATTHEGRLILNGMFQVEDRPGKHRLFFLTRGHRILANVPCHG